MSRRTKGQKSLHCPGTKGQQDRSPFFVPGQRDKLKILPQNGPGRYFDILPRDRPGQDFDSLSRPVPEYPRAATGQKEKNNNKITIFEKKKFLRFFFHFFVPGRPGTEMFVPGFLHLPLSRNRGTAGQAKLFCPGTAGQGIFFVPGQRDNRKSRPGLSREVPWDVPSLGNPSISYSLYLVNPS